jgi:hypothetical protein
LIVTDELDPVTITFSTDGGNKRFFLDEVKVFYEQDPTATVSLNKYGYATYCSVNPMDFSSTEDYTAWRISAISSDGTITFNKITSTIKGGQGVLLYNKNADGVNKTNATIKFADGSTVFNEEENLFIGTTAPRYVAAGEYIGLSGDTFVPITSAGNIPAGKAIIPMDAIPAGARDFKFVFEDDGETTAISSMHNSQCTMHNEYFDLQGRRVAQPTKGLYIVNGRKVVIK